jgi:hypothetical protein
MARGSDKNYVSFWFWFFALFVAALPCIGLVMILVWAFAGENESRKNYFRALIAWGVLAIALWLVAAVLLGFAPVMMQQLDRWLKAAHVP